jgi:cysteinyl-tRNA synthetase
MIRSVLGEQIDIHAGGADLIFPHHENEIAQSECCTGKAPFVRTWMHNGFVNVDGEKMSKSLGNFATIRALLTHYPANTLRYFILTNHYRMPVDFTPEALDAAHNWMVKASLFLTTLSAVFPQLFEPLPTWQDATAQALLQQHLPQFIEALAADMNTPKALASVNGLMKQLRKSANVAEQQQLLKTLLIALQVLGFNVIAFCQPNLVEESASVGGGVSGTVPPLVQLQETFAPVLTPEQLATFNALPEPTDWIAGLLTLRSQAKQAKNWALADAIRAGVTTLGGTLTDTPQGSSITW